VFLAENRLPGLVVLFPAQFWFSGLWVEFLEELHQPVDQPASASDHMQTALVLVLFQYFIQTAFQLIHTTPPQTGSSYVNNPHYQDF
jgi:hypothetical protein